MRIRGLLAIPFFSATLSFITFVCPVSDVLLWYKIRDFFFGHGLGGALLTLALASACEHPEANWLVASDRPCVLTKLTKLLFCSSIASNFNREQAMILLFFYNKDIL